MPSVTLATPNPKPTQASDRLDSWKEIAAHLGRTVRTVQRWERSCSLPVHRHRHAEASSVYAFRSELDAWWVFRRGDLSRRPHSSSSGQGREAESVVGPVSGLPPGNGGQSSVLWSPSGRRSRYSVGRSLEMGQLRNALDRVGVSGGLLVAVSGEPGIGKTTLVDGFVAATAGTCYTARSRSSERLAGTETYLPLLDALDDLLRRDPGRTLGELLRTFAPLWHAQLSPAQGSDAVAPAGQAGAEQRIKRELLSFLQEASRERPVVLFLDDLHWADPSTLDLLGYLAGHFDALRILVIVAYRPDELLLQQHPFVSMKHDLVARGLCRTIEPRLLGRQDIDEYVALRLPAHALPPEFVDTLFVRTEGNPLFMSALLDYLCESGAIGQSGGVWRLMRPIAEITGDLPESVLGMIQRKIDRLSDGERKLLLAASVQGLEFTAAIVADVVGDSAADAEDRLVRLESVFGLVQRVADVELPDGRLTRRHRFVHILYQEHLQSLLTPARLVSLSRDTACSLERAYGEHAPEIASRLAVLYETARDFRRAAECFLTATRRAFKVFAYQDAIALGHRGLDAATHVRDDEQRRRCELQILFAIAFPVKAVQGFASDELPQLYERARILCTQLGETRELADVVWGQWSSQAVRLELEAAQQSCERLHELGAQGIEPRVAVQARIASSLVAYYRGDFPAAYDSCEQALALYQPELHGPLRVTAGWDPAMSVQGHMAWTSLALGFPDRAVQEVEDGVRRARDVGHVHTLVYALCFAALVHQWRGDQVRFRQSLDEMRRLALDYQLVHFTTVAAFLEGQILAEHGRLRDGIEQMREGLRQYERLGARTSHARFVAALAEALGRSGRSAEGLQLVDGAIAGLGLARFYEAELLRVRGELLARHATAEARIGAERSFMRAVGVARAQEARSFELRAILSLCRLRCSTPAPDAIRHLQSLLRSFTEGFDTEDVLAARALLAA